jgi:acetolactate synthase I/III small subunit
MSSKETPTQRTFIATVEDRPGVLARVVSLFRRRGYNIASLTVGRTHEPGTSHLTVVTEANADVARRIQADLHKLVNVLDVEMLAPEDAIVRDLALIKVSVSEETRPRVLDLCEGLRARVVDVDTDALTVQMSGTTEKIDGLLEALAPFGILEMVSTGAIAMARSGRRPDAPRYESSPPPEPKTDQDPSKHFAA